MFCPQCGDEYPWDVTVCPACDQDLVDRLPGPTPDPEAELARVFVSGEAAEIALAKSLLEGEEIEYLLRGDGLQDLFGVGRLSLGFSNVVGPAEFWVRADDAERAHALLEAITATPPGDLPPSDFQDE